MDLVLLCKSLFEKAALVGRSRICGHDSPTGRHRGNAAQASIAELLRQPHTATGECRAHSELSSPPASRRADFRLTSEFDFPQFLGPQRTGWVRSPELARDWESNPPRLIWQRTIGPGWSSFAANQNYAVTMEQRGEEECVVCYELATGNSVWSHAIVGRHDTALGGVGPRATPTIYNGYVYALGATGVLRCLNESGELVWSDDLRKRYGVTSQEDEANVMFGRSASPLIVDACVVVAGGGLRAAQRTWSPSIA